MHEADQLETLDCGCRQDGTHLCDVHETEQAEQQMAKVGHALHNARVPLSLPYNASEERY